MTPQEIINLLTIAAAFDNRKPGQATVHAWLDSATRGRWTFDEAAEAIKDYYATTTDDKPWVMPSHITARIHAVRQDQEMRSTAKELATPVDPRVRRLVSTLAHRLAIPEQFRPSGELQRVLAVECPHCKASPGNPCTRPSIGGPQETSPHPSRREAAEQEAS
jgi:hypothetical protein